MRRSIVLMFVALCAIGAASMARAQNPAPPAQAGSMQVYQPADLTWKDGPGSLPPGAKFVVLEGDPTKEGPFTMRVQVPDGFRIPPHFHGGVEHITVLAGTFNVGMGDTFDAAAVKKMPAGSFGFWPGGMRHFVFTEGQTTVQLHGLGPWTVTYVNPADDPRKK